MSEKNMIVKDRSCALLKLADEVISQIHYKNMAQLPQCELDSDIEKIKPCDVTCLFRISEDRKSVV